MKIIKERKSVLVYQNNGRLLIGIVGNRGSLSGFVCQLILGAGAGCKDGSTAFLAWRSGSLRWRQAHRSSCQINFLARLTGLEIGITRNANKVPYAL
jgi:hypothetical protein